MTFYLAVAFSFAFKKTPWVDEGWIASAPANWARTGSLGTPSLEPTGSWLDAELTGIQTYTYWNFPVSIALQAAWYKVVGFSIVKMRALSITSGLLALISWFAIVGKVSGSRTAACVTVVLLSLDFTFLWAAADGRMDMMCCGLGAAGLASYVTWREERLWRALWVANALLALSLFTHPNGALFLIVFLVLLSIYDRDRVSWKNLPLLVPYLLIAALWAVYALKKPGYFLAQMAANSMALGGARWGGLTHPLLAIKSEILIRYLAHYGLHPFWAGDVPHYALVIPLSYWIALLGALIFWYLRRSKALVILLSLTVLVATFMTFLVGLKANIYLVFILPLYAAGLAVFARECHARRSAWAPVSLFLLLTIIGCNIGVIVFKLRQDAFASEYAPTVEFVRTRLHPLERVTADSYFGFDLGFERVRDDCRVGYYSGVRTRLIIEDFWYGTWWQTLFPGQEPEVGNYVAQLLRTNYRVIFRKGRFLVYERRGG